MAAGDRLGLKLDEDCYLQAAVPQQPDQVAEAEVKLHGVVVWPSEPVHAEVRTHYPLGGGSS